MISKNVIIAVSLVCLIGFFCCNTKETKTEGKDSELYKAALEMADLSCKSRSVTGKELEEVEKKGTELGEKISKLFESKEDSTKFIQFLFEAQEKICPELFKSGN